MQFSNESRPQNWIPSRIEFFQRPESGQQHCSEARGVMGTGPSISSNFFHCRFPLGFVCGLICFASLLNGWSRSLSVVPCAGHCNLTGPFSAGRNPHHAPQTMQHPALPSPISSSDFFSIRFFFFMEYSFILFNSSDKK